MRIRAAYLLAALGILIAEIGVATTFSDIVFIRSYLSDYLVVILLFCLARSFWDVSPLALSLAIFIFACAVELSQYFHLADALGLPHGSLLSVLLGTSFSWIDILMYFLGCLTCYGMTAWFLRRPTNPALSRK